MKFQATQMLPWFIRRWILFRKGEPAPQLYFFEDDTLEDDSKPDSSHCEDLEKRG